MSRAVALLALAACVLPGCRAQSAGQAAPAKISIAAVAPKGQSAAPFVFAWTSNAPAGTVYRMTVFDAAERQLLERETREMRVDVTRDLELLAASTPRFLWKVSVLGENGEAVAQTPLVEFAVVVSR